MTHLSLCSINKDEAGKFAKVMVEQWEIYFARTSKPDTDGLNRVIADVYNRYPDIKTDEKYLM